MAKATTDVLTALEKLTHTTKANPDPIMPLQAIGEHIPAMFRRAAINAAMGSARSFFTHLNQWKAHKSKAEAKGKEYGDRPPVPPRTWNKSAPFYSGLWKERTNGRILLKVWTGTCWSWVKLRTLGREVPTGFELGSPSLIRKGERWWLHTPLEKAFKGPAKIVEQVTKTHTKLCAVDLNLGDSLAVCTIQTVEGTILATTFLTGGNEIAGFRKRQLGIIARNRSKTRTIAQGEQDNTALWKRIRYRDEDLAHQISARIVTFAKEHEASILVFEHLGNLKPEKGTYSRRGNSKRAFWMKGSIFQFSKYKAWNEGIITSRVNPRNTSRECARCHTQVARYRQGHPAEGYTPGAPLVFCSHCGRRGNADRNAAIVIGQRLITRSQEKPPTPHDTHEEDAKASGVIICQDAKGEEEPSISPTRHADRQEHGTAHGETPWMEERSPSIPTQLRFFSE
ncbi:MAG: transposase [Chloroflexota bacterium]|nr:transposase [Chloroflexota bacterium]